MRLRSRANSKQPCAPRSSSASAATRACRLGKAQRASSGRARCRHCREVIAKDTWRLPLLFFEEGIFNGSGFIHAGCVQAYTGSADMEPLVSHFARDLDDADRQTVLDCVRQQVSG